MPSISWLLPNPQLFLYTYVRQEAVLSSQIEGTQSSLSDLLLYELGEAPGVPIDDVIEVSNYVAAMEYGLGRLTAGFPLCGRLLREMHAKLMARGRGSNKAPGEFRRVQNWVGGASPGRAIFIPSPPHIIESCMADLERFMHNHEQPVLLKAALIHVQFETIHPFLDGNGRLGRLLIALVLHDGGVLKQPLLYLSLYFKQHRSTYYDLLNQVRTTGDWEAWLDFFLDGVLKTVHDAESVAKRLDALFQQDMRRIPIGRGAKSAAQVFAALRQRPLYSISQLCLDTNMTFPTASKAMQTLVTVGIVRELTGHRRNRVFVYENYLRILNADKSLPDV